MGTTRRAGTVDDADTDRPDAATTDTSSEPRCWACDTASPPDPAYRTLGVHRCPACGLRFAPVASAAELLSRYDASYFTDHLGAYDADAAQRRFEARLRVTLLRDHVRTGRILEVGCASGYFLEAVRQQGFEPEGIEPSEDMAREARRRSGARVHAGTLDDAPLPPDGFDAACAWHVLEHIVQPAQSLERVREALRPGGVLLVEVPNVDSVNARRRGHSWLGLDPAHHVAHYAPASLRTLLESAGFAVQRMESFPWPAYARPALAVRPPRLAGQLIDVLRTRTPPLRPHPWKHEMLRAVARTPTGSVG